MLAGKANNQSSSGLFAPVSEASSLPPAVPPEVGLSCAVAPAFCFFGFASPPLFVRDRFLPDAAVPLVSPSVSSDCVAFLDAFAGSILVAGVPFGGGGNAQGATEAA